MGYPATGYYGSSETGYNEYPVGVALPYPGGRGSYYGHISGGPFCYPAGGPPSVVGASDRDPLGNDPPDRWSRSPWTT